MNQPEHYPDLVIVDDEAWTREEYEAEQRRREHKRAYESRPERKAAKKARRREWERRHPDRVREIRRESMRRARAKEPRIVGFLHELACTGPTKATGCVCKKIACYDKPREAAA